jgi:hypothetical protein
MTQARHWSGLLINSLSHNALLPVRFDISWQRAW